MAPAQTRLCTLRRDAFEKSRSLINVQNIVSVTGDAAGSMKGVCFGSRFFRAAGLRSAMPTKPFAYSLSLPG
jgi:hypothetical protein